MRLLEGYGVDTVFGIPGNHTVQLYRGLAGSKIRHVTPRHEQGAAFMADGYARASGKPGVCFLISGPGLTNAATAMMQALADSSPLLIISAVAARHELGMGEGRLHELPDQRALASQCSRFSHTLMRPQELPRVLARAFAVLCSERPGPVHIELPLDVIVAPADDVPLQPWPIPSRPGPAPESLARAVAELEAAQRPLLVIGGGAVDCADAVREFADLFDLPVINTVNAKGVLPAEHPLAVGGSPSLPSVRRALTDADVILAVGTEFGETDYDMLFLGELNLPGRVIRIDIDARQHARNVEPWLALTADAGLSLNAMIALRRAAAGPLLARDGVARTALLRQEIAQEAHVHPEFASLFSTLRSTLPELILVGDSTLPTYYAVWQYEAALPRHYFHSATGGGTLGFAIPAAMGAKLACPQAPVVALIGDGSAQFTLAELAAGAQAKLSVAVLVWNNNGYGEIKQGMLAAQVEPVGVDIPAPDFMALAVGFGCTGVAARDHKELREALLAAQERPHPTLIELRQDDFISLPAGQWY